MKTKKTKKHFPPVTYAISAIPVEKRKLDWYFWDSALLLKNKVQSSGFSLNGEWGIGNWETSDTESLQFGSTPGVLYLGFQLNDG